jgi:uncharacterized membrane protein YtjA (UPF0391 family)
MAVVIVMGAQCTGRAAGEQTFPGAGVDRTTSVHHDHPLWTAAGRCTDNLTEWRMLYWALVFLVLAIIAAIFGFGGIAASAAGIAKILFVLFLVVFAVSLVANTLRGRRAL